MELGILLAHLMEVLDQRTTVVGCFGFRVWRLNGCSPPLWSRFPAVAAPSQESRSSPSSCSLIDKDHRSRSHCRLNPLASRSSGAAVTA